MRSYISLNENKDFLRLYYRGKSVAAPSLVVYAKKNPFGQVRMGITTGKKIGNAVERNRSRRIIRAAFDRVTTERTIKGGWDIVLVARTKTRTKKSGALYNVMIDAFTKLGVI